MVMLKLTVALQHISSDVIVVWRAWVLWPDSKPVRLSLVFAILGTIGELLRTTDVYSLTKLLVSGKRRRFRLLLLEVRRRRVLVEPTRQMRQLPPRLHLHRPRTHDQRTRNSAGRRQSMVRELPRSSIPTPPNLTKDLPTQHQARPRPCIADARGEDHGPPRRVWRRI